MSAMIYRLFNGDPFRNVSTSVPVSQDRALRKRGSFKRSRELKNSSNSEFKRKTYLKR